MRFNRWREISAIVCLLALAGCEPGTENQADEQKNPYFVAGKERTAARDYKGAIEAFEKALEINPRSVLAHFELAVLYEQHSDQKDTDYIAAMYHYQQVVRMRPGEYPADNARQRIAGCKQELVKGEALAPVAQNLIRENERLRTENRDLHKKLESVRVETARVPLAQPTPIAQTPTGRSEAQSPQRTNNVASPKPVAATTVARNHTVRPGETAYAIAKRYRVPLQSLLTANPRVDPNRMKAGQVLFIPTS